MKIDFQTRKEAGEKKEKALNWYGYIWTMFSLGKGKVGDLWYFVSIATLFGVFNIPLELLPAAAVVFIIGTVIIGIILTKKFIAQKEQEVATKINPVFMEIIGRLERIENQLNQTNGHKTRAYKKISV
ncbi:MAG: hypothetical protein HY513_03215 [Candidatus Aenigmarchaeota archaeon]|nr:hypothetical protein [Candidatus Aenigmarchaeota archaeon]